MKGIQSLEQVVVCVLLDFSDSYHKAFDDIDGLRKTLASWPEQWRLHFYCLSSPTLVLSQSIAQFCEGEERVEDHVQVLSAQSPFQFRGSFLRPCMEAIERERALERQPLDRIVFVLSDGRFTDILHSPIPSWMRVVVISSETRKPTDVPMPVWQWGTPQVSDFIKHLIPAVPCRFSLVMKQAPPGVRTASIWRDVVRPWANGIESVLERDNLPTWIFSDFGFDKSRHVNWEIRSKTQIQGMHVSFDATEVEDRDLRNALSAFIIKDSVAVRLLFERQLGDESFERTQRFFAVAESGSTERKSWSRGDLKSCFFELLGSSERACVEDVDSVFLVAARRSGSVSEHYIAAIGLSRTSDARLMRGDKLGQWIAEEDILFRFDREKRRWMLTVGGRLVQELGISSQPIKLPLSFGSSIASIVFAKL
jgi:hypothetical protein